MVTVLFNTGDQLPLIPLLLVLGNVKESPLQISEIGSNKGVVGAGPLTVIVADETQPFASVTVTVYVPSVKFEILLNSLLELFVVLIIFPESSCHSKSQGLAVVCASAVASPSDKP